MFTPAVSSDSVPDQVLPAAAEVTARLVSPCRERSIAPEHDSVIRQSLTEPNNAGTRLVEKEPVEARIEQDAAANELPDFGSLPARAATLQRPLSPPTHCKKSRLYAPRASKPCHSL